ncbi:unnamed protein product [Sordaria macrospora k-hell]|uniref:WGS project CABT00000000 data, contig 2.21 n=1 Tax=Sordaria macrospora (strain ATCC MYA-333 / DSM 997 / K(L3346) / K-hell) TaxID=771870 RepID=F7W280_SORMK|nr:uncharacterized protein SMAC_04712 [Sordaria macrospora k-hell]CCC11730.1 unnamed protein product [Sordaria macrospora k-hell]
MSADNPVLVDDGWPPPAVPPVPEEQPQRDPDTFLATVIGLLPDLCPEYAHQHGHEYGWDPELFLNRVLEEDGNGTKYPRRVKKRKRDGEDVGDHAKESKLQRLRKTYEGHVSDHRGDHHYIRVGRSLLVEAFPKAYVADIMDALGAHNFSIYHAYSALHEDFSKLHSFTLRRKPASKHKKTIEEIGIYNRDPTPQGTEAEQQFLAAQEVCSAKLAKDTVEEAREREEKENFEKAKAEGAITECECCFDELPYNRMAHCDGDSPHWFCYDCARRQAENQIGQQQHHLGCMSMDGCEATFSRHQKDLFLDDRLKRTLELIEQNDSIRRAGIEGLETCPFCNYAAEYPPSGETHIGKSCEEAMAESARNKGEDAKRKLEEARSLAMIRECYKCKNRQPCDYTHFDDVNRGGKKGNCPLFERESLDEIHDREAREAEERERMKLLEADPSINAQELEIKFDEKLFPKRQQPAQANGVHVPGAYPVPLPARVQHVLADAIARRRPNQAHPALPGAAHVQPPGQEADFLHQYVMRLPPGPMRDRFMERLRMGGGYPPPVQQPVQQQEGQVANGNLNQAMNRGLAGYDAPGVPPDPLPKPNPNNNPNLNRRPVPNPAPNPHPPAVHNRNHRPNSVFNPVPAPPPYPGFGPHAIHHNHNHNRYMLNAQFPANVHEWNAGVPDLFGLEPGLRPLPPNDGFGLPQIAAAPAPRRAALPPPVAVNNERIPGFDVRIAGPAQPPEAPDRQGQVAPRPPGQQEPDEYETEIIRLSRAIRALGVRTGLLSPNEERGLIDQAREGLLRVVGAIPDVFPVQEPDVARRRRGESTMRAEAGSDADMDDVPGTLDPNHEPRSAAELAQARPRSARARRRSAP